MPYDPRAVANAFLEIARAQGQSIDPMKLQKLVYYAHGWYLALADAPLLDRAVEAWKYGPVIPVLYRTFQQFGADPITDPARHPVNEGDKVVLRPYSLADAPDSTYASRIIRRVWEQYGKYSAIHLSMMTHAPGTPWAEVWADNQGRRYVPIPDASIQQYFKNALKPVAA
jgi:uncharacterized phage-associated protein